MPNPETPPNPPVNGGEPEPYVVRVLQVLRDGEAHGMMRRKVDRLAGSIYPFHGAQFSALEQLRLIRCDHKMYRITETGKMVLAGYEGAGI